MNAPIAAAPWMAIIFNFVASIFLADNEMKNSNNELLMDQTALREIEC
jgi:hypothetical protein